MHFIKRSDATGQKRFLIFIAATIFAVFAYKATVFGPTFGHSVSFTHAESAPAALPATWQKPADVIVPQGNLTITPEEFNILVQTVWAEARGDGYKGMRAVAEVILNRAHKNARCWPNNVKEVVLQQKQFSCWNLNDPNLKKIKNLNKRSKSYQLAEKAVHDALKGSNMTQGATHYHTHRVRPQWARGVNPVVKIGQHRFYKF